jgi:hypothetical protein
LSRPHPLRPPVSGGGVYDRRQKEPVNRWPTGTFRGSNSGLEEAESTQRKEIVWRGLTAGKYSDGRRDWQSEFYTSDLIIHWNPSFILIIMYCVLLCTQGIWAAGFYFYFVFFITQSV